MIKKIEEMWAYLLIIDKLSIIVAGEYFNFSMKHAMPADLGTPMVLLVGLVPSQQQARRDSLCISFTKATRSSDTDFWNFIQRLPCFDPLKAIIIPFDEISKTRITWSDGLLAASIPLSLPLIMEP